jgi:two-component system, OmpR family, phosphate regulon sensor histidine kinase PhoR
MNKLGTARLLMAVTILLIIAFQSYWLNKLYHEEDNNFKKSVDIIFRESMYRLQAERFKSDTMFFRGMPGDNLFMTDLISSVRKDEKKNGDSTERKVTISLKRDATLMNDHITDSFFKFKSDTVLYVNF